MKKSFFRKLSFVLVLAMVMALIVPATGALADAAPKLNSTKKYLHLDVEDKNEFDFNIKNKKSGWKYLWESSDEDVVEVNNVGLVTATGVGTAKVTVFITDKKGNVIDDLTATVVVRDNIKEVNITNKPEDDKLAVGVAHDFNRSFVTVSASTKKTSAITRWTVTPEGAEIDDKGVFVATKADKYTITARSFQSKEKYKLWKEDPEANAGYVLATDTYEVTVAPSMLSAKQKNFTEAVLTFDADMSEEITKDNIKVYRVVAGTDVEQMVKGIKFNDDGTQLTVETYLEFMGGETYKFAYGDLSKTFVAVKKNDPDTVKKVVIETTEVDYTSSAPVDVVVKLYTEDDVDITTTSMLDRVTLKLLEGNAYVDENNRKIVMFAKDDVVTIEAIFHTYQLDSNYDEITVSTTGRIRAVDAPSYTLSGTVEWTLAKSAPDWSKAKVTTLAAGDAGYSVWVRVRSTDSNNEKYYYSYTNLDKAVDNNDPSKFTFESNNSDVLIVNTYGTIYPVKAGEAVIICKYDNTPIGTFKVTVAATRVVTQVTLDPATPIVLSNSTAVNETAEIELTIKDQLDENITPTTFKIDPFIGNPSGAGPAVLDVSNKKIVLSGVVGGSSVAEGTYNYKLTADNVIRTFSVKVQAPSSTTVTRWELKLSSAAVDLKAGDDNVIKTITPELIGYAANNVKTQRVTGDASSWAAAGFSYTVTKDGSAADKYTDDTSADLTDGSIEVTLAGSALSTPTQTVASAGAINAVSGTGVKTLATGTYLVTVYNSTGKVVYMTYFNVTNSTPAATFDLKQYETNADYILAAVRDCFKVFFNGSEVNSNDLYGVTYVDTLTGATQEYDRSLNDTNDDSVLAGTYIIKSVKFIKTYTESSTSTTYAVEYTANIDRPIVVK